MFSKKNFKDTIGYFLDFISYHLLSGSPSQFALMVETDHQNLRLGWPEYDNRLYAVKKVRVTRLLFSQNDSTMRGLSWQKDNLITHILFELQPIIRFSPVAVNFGDQPLGRYRQKSQYKIRRSIWTFPSSKLRPTKKVVYAAHAY